MTFDPSQIHGMYEWMYAMYKFKVEEEGSEVCPTCHGARLKPEALAVNVGGKNIFDVAQLTIRQCQRFFDGLELTDKDRKISRAVVYGGGIYCKMFLTSQYSVSQLPVTRQIVGIIDDNPSLRGLNVYGQNVLGTSRDLDELKAKYQFNEIVIALGPITDRMREKLKRFGAENNVRVVDFTFQIGTPLETSVGRVEDRVNEG